MNPNDLQESEATAKRLREDVLGFQKIVEKLANRVRAKVTFLKNYQEKMAVPTAASELSHEEYPEEYSQPFDYSAMIIRLRFAFCALAFTLVMTYATLIYLLLPAITTYHIEMTSSGTAESQTVEKYENTGNFEPTMMTLDNIIKYKREHNGNSLSFLVFQAVKKPHPPAIHTPTTYATTIQASTTQAPKPLLDPPETPPSTALTQVAPQPTVLSNVLLTVTPSGSSEVPARLRRDLKAQDSPAWMPADSDTSEQSRVVRDFFDTLRRSYEKAKNTVTGFTNQLVLNEKDEAGSDNHTKTVVRKTRSLESLQGLTQTDYGIQYAEPTGHDFNGQLRFYPLPPTQKTHRKTDAANNEQVEAPVTSADMTPSKEMEEIGVKIGNLGTNCKDEPMQPKMVMFIVNLITPTDMTQDSFKDEQLQFEDNKQLAKDKNVEVKMLVLSDGLAKSDLKDNNELVDNVIFLSKAGDQQVKNDEDVQSDLEKATPGLPASETGEQLPKYGENMKRVTREATTTPSPTPYEAARSDAGPTEKSEVGLETFEDKEQSANEEVKLAAIPEDLTDTSVKESVPTMTTAGGGTLLQAAPDGTDFNMPAGQDEGLVKKEHAFPNYPWKNQQGFV